MYTSPGEWAAWRGNAPGLSETTAKLLVGPSGRMVGNSSGADPSGFRLDSDTVIHRRCNPLGAAEIALGSLYGNMPKKKLNLLQFAAGGAAKPSATSSLTPHAA